MFQQTEPDLQFSIKLADSTNTKGKVIRGKEESFQTGEKLHDWWVRNSHKVNTKRRDSTLRKKNIKK